jgi:CelD/BcsL family acetyltransferase involved in cellulose biosynthesis
MALRSLSISRTPACSGPLTAATTLSCSVVTALDEAERLQPAWNDLLQRSQSNELTLSPEWLLTWWRVYGPQDGRQLRLALFFDAGRLVGLAPLLRRRHWYRRIVSFRRLEFLASGEREGHGIYSNHLNILAERGTEEAVARSLVAALTAGVLGDWDEIVLPMMNSTNSMSALLAAAFHDAGLIAEVIETARAPYLSLPTRWDDYLTCLSRGQRRHVTRSLRDFQQWADGTERLECVTNLAELEKGRRILIGLHHARWEEGRQTGVFRAPSYLQFHETIMRELLQRGALELLWLSVRGEPVAALYGMVWANKVYAYQTGRRLDVPAHIRPGGVILALAIRRAIEQRRREFDLLADEAPYKLQLTATVRSLVRLRVVRAGLRESSRRLLEGCFGVVRPLRRALGRLWP